jgi:subtilase family serine protease
MESKDRKQPSWSIRSIWIAGVLLLMPVIYLTVGGPGYFTTSATSEKPDPIAEIKKGAVITGACSLGGNLIVNGEAEADPAATGDGTVNHDVTSWENETGDFTITRYNSINNFPTSTGPGPENRGTFFFSGGRTASSSATQTIDLTSCAAEIDSNGQRFLLSGFLGGFSSSNDQTSVVLSFRDAGNLEVGAASIGPLTAGDRRNVTGLFPRSKSGVVPVGTRTVEVKVQITRFDTTFNDGYADNLSLILLAPHQQTCAPLPSDIMSWWKGEGNSFDFLDFNNGVLQNGTTFSSGIVGQAFSFDGVDDHVTAARTIQDDFTIEFWVNTTQNISNGSVQWYNGRGLVDAEVSSVTNDFGVSLLNGKIYFGTGNPDVTIISGVVADGSWHHIAATRRRTAGDMRLYVDGNVIAAALGGTQSLTAAPRVVFGRIQVNNNPFQGKLDEISIYNRPLTLSEIQAIYSAGAIGKCGLSAIQSLTLDPNPVNGGQSSTGTVILTSPAPPEGALVELVSENPAVAQVPAILTVPPGAITETFPVITSVPVVDSTALITASYQGETASASLTVIAPRADLTITSANAPSSTTTDTAFNLSWILKNQGIARANGPWKDKVLLSTDNQIGGDTQLAEFPFNANLEVDQTADRIQTITVPANSISANGQYFLLIRTDADGQVIESNENNNFVALPINVTRPPKPDLIVESIVAPNTAFFDQTISVQFTVKNIGDGPTNAPDWRDFVYLSVDNIPEIEDPFKIAVPNTSYLASGESYTSSVEIRIPKGLAGQYKIIAWTDSDGSNHRTNAWPQRVLEVNEENNFGIAIPIQINVPPLPDLRASAVVAPEQVFAGGQMSLNWQVENNGDGVTPQDQITWKDRIYLSEDTLFNPATDRSIGTRERTGALAPNEGYTVSNFIITLPNDIAGDRYVFVVADGDNSVYEFNSENNNTDYDRQQPGSPMHIGATPPDLIIPDAINTPVTGHTGESIPVSWTVRNQGAFDAAPSWFDGVYLSSDQTLDTANDILLTSQFRNAPLGPGLTYNASANAVLPSCISGTYYLFVTSDSRRQIFEFDPKQDAEVNNTSQPRAITISNTASDLVVTAVDHPASGSAGQPLNVSWTVTNQGVGPTLRTTWTDRIYLSPTPQFNGPTAILIGSFDRNGALNNGQSYTRSENIPVPTTAQGSYFVIVVADSNGEEDECTNNGNNGGSGSDGIFINNSLPDLIVQAAALQSNFIGGQTVTLGWTIANNGTIPANNQTWGDAVYFSTDASLNGNDRRLATSAASGPLAAGGTYDRQAEVVLPVVPPGSYFLIVQTDYLNNVFEGQGENNNTGSVALPVEVPSVDLRVTSVDVPDSAFSGQNMTVNWTVINSGTNATIGSQWTDEIVISLDQIDDPSDRVVGFKLHNGAINGGASYNESLQVSVPQGITGQYYVFVRTDRHNTVAESNENNNSAADGVVFDLTPPADLIVSNVGTLSNATPGEPATFNWTVQNLGTNPALGLWSDTIYLSHDQVWDAGDILIDKRSQLGPLNGGESYNGSLTLPLPAVDPGTYYVIIRTDVRNYVRETNENNNTGIAVVQTTVDVPVLQIGVPRNTTLLTGQEKFYKTNAPANETLQFLLEGQAGSSNELFARFGHIAGPLAFDYSFTRPNEPNQEIVIPNTQPGDYFTRIKSRNSIPSTQNVTVKAEVIPFGITSVAPNRVGDNGQVTLTLSGARFEEGATVKLVRDQTILNAATVIRINSSTVKARFQFADAPRGVYNVVLTNPNKQSAILSDGLTIELAQSAQPTIISTGNLRTRPLRSLGFYNEVSNRGNVDIQYVSIRTQVFRPNSSDPITIINYRPENSFPRKTNYPTVDWNNAPVTNSTFRNLTTDTFLYRDLAPGETLSYNTEIRGLNLDTSYVRSQVVGQTKSEMAAAIRETAEFTRQELIERGINAPHTETEESFIDFFEAFLEFEGLFEGAIENIPSSYREAIQGALREAKISLVFSGAENACNIVADHGISNCGVKCAAKFGCCNIGTAAYVVSSVGSYGTGNVIFGTLNAFMIGWTGAKCVSEAYNCFTDCPKPPPPDCQMGGGSDSEEFNKACVSSAIDPNEKLSPDGYGPQRFVSVQQEIPYTVNFENLAEATAYAQRIRITDHLDPDLDWRTFRLKEIGFKQYRFQVPENRAFFQQRVQLGADLNNLLADISAGIDISTGTITWTLTAIDPATGEQPNGTDLGLLPPNNENNDGQGFVTFTVKPKSTVFTGALIQNKATIVFDTEEPIDTNTVSNTLDADPPESQVAALPPVSEPAFDLNWSGIDPAKGSGLRSYDVFVSENGGAYQPLVNGTSETVKQFTGSRGKTYRFYSVARDNAGNKEEAPATPDAVTTVAGGAFEADVDPRPNGTNDGAVSGTDVTQIGRFVAGLDTPDQPTATNEYQRADCAPRSTKGNGALTVTDLTQAGRYSSGLDVPQAVGGAISGGLNLPRKTLLSGPREIRPVRIARNGNKVTIGIQLETGAGDESANAVGFTLDFDPSVLSNPSNIVPGSGAVGTTLIINAGQAGQRRLGIVIFKPANQTFSTGLQQIVTLEFDVAPGPVTSTAIGFSSQIAARDVSNANADSLSANFITANIPLTTPTAASVTIGGRVLNASGNGISGARLTMARTDGTVRTAITNPFGYYSFPDVSAGTTVFINISARQYNFTVSTRVLTVTDDNNEVNFTADN